MNYMEVHSPGPRTPCGPRRTRQRTRRPSWLPRIPPSRPARNKQTDDTRMPRKEKEGTAADTLAGTETRGSIAEKPRWSFGPKSPNALRRFCAAEWRHGTEVETTVARGCWLRTGRLLHEKRRAPKTPAANEHGGRGTPCQEHLRPPYVCNKSSLQFVLSLQYNRAPLSRCERAVFPFF